MKRKEKMHKFGGGIIDFEILKKRAEFLQLTRRFFIEQGYLEVETPILSPYLIPEPSLEIFKTTFYIRSEQSLECYLIPSPELWMKRLIAQGAGNIFQVTKAFRNCESLGKLHNPEFTLLEWYTEGHDYQEEIVVLERLILFLSEKMHAETVFSTPFRRISMHEAFHTHTGVDLDEVADEESIRKVARHRGINVNEDESWEETFHKIFLTLVEPALAKEKTIILYDYPEKIPTFARTREGYSERWELYMHGVEIANCYTEEMSKQKLKHLFEAEAQRKKRCAVQHTIDPSLPDIFSDYSGDCAGVALGMDRLFMVLFGFQSVERVLPFSFSKIF